MNVAVWWADIGRNVLYGLLKDGITENCDCIGNPAEEAYGFGLAIAQQLARFSTSGWLLNSGDYKFSS